MAVLQDTADFQIVPSDPTLSRAHSRPQRSRDHSSTTSSHVASPDSHAAVQDGNRTTVIGIPLAVVEKDGRDGLSSSGAMTASLPTPGDVMTSSASDKRELSLSSARMKRRESRKSKSREPREVSQKPSLDINVKEGGFAAHSTQEAVGCVVVGGGGEIALEGERSDGRPGKRRSPKKRAATREDTVPPHQEEEVDGVQLYQLVMHFGVDACTCTRTHTHTHLLLLLLLLCSPCP